MERGEPPPLLSIIRQRPTTALRLASQKSNTFIKTSSNKSKCCPNCILSLGGSLTAATPRGVFRSRDIYTGTRWLAHSSHPSRHFSLTRHLYWHSGAHSQ